MSNSQSYKTIDAISEVLHKDRGSKFIGIAYPTDSIDDVKVQLDQLKETYPDATHICYAYVLGINGEDYRANDDGEPNNSAGQPILSEIRSADITNVLVAVIRYYGGKKLGVSGLIDAYGTAARLALEQTNSVVKVVQKKCWIRHNGAKDFMVFEYANRLGFTILTHPSQPGGYFEIELPEQNFPDFLLALESLPNFDLQEELDGH